MLSKVDTEPRYKIICWDSVRGRVELPRRASGPRASLCVDNLSSDLLASISDGFSPQNPEIDTQCKSSVLVLMEIACCLIGVVCTTSTLKPSCSGVTQAPYDTTSGHDCVKPLRLCLPGFCPQTYSLRILRSWECDHVRFWETHISLVDHPLAGVAEPFQCRRNWPATGFTLLI